MIALTTRPAFLLAIVAIFLAVPLCADIMYVTPGPNDQNGLPTSVVRLLNPDGTNPRALNLPGVPAPQFPAASADGRFVSFTTRNPLKPLDRSASVIQLDRSNGTLTRIIGFEDQVQGNGEVFSS